MNASSGTPILDRQGHWPGSQRKPSSTPGK